MCTPLTLVAPNAAQTHLFADDVHLSTAGQQVLADYEYSLIVAPSMISMLAEAPVQTRAALVNTIQSQIPVSQGQNGVAGFNAWITGSISSLQIDNSPGFPNDPGTPLAFVAGLDYKISKEWLVGIVFAGGHQHADFSLGFGSFTQDEFSISSYLVARHGDIWFDTVGTYGALNYDVSRNVAIGITVQSNTAKTTGSDISLAAEGGYDFHFGNIVHGPLAGITLQQVHVDGFTESGSFTSLAFGSQTRNSAVSDFGYRLTIDYGRWAPFARAAWYHEFGGAVLFDAGGNDRPQLGCFNCGHAAENRRQRDRPYCVHGHRGAAERHHLLRTDRRQCLVLAATTRRLAASLSVTATSAT